MKILLIAPTHQYPKYPSVLSASDFPAGIAYIASSLAEAGHDVYGLNPNNVFGYDSAYSMIYDQIIQALEIRPDIVGLGGICTNYPFLRDAIQIVRENSKAQIVLGGGIVTHDAEFIYKTLSPDFAVVGDGEISMERIASGKIGKGIIFSEPVNVDSVPFPDFDSFGMKEMIDKFSQSTRVLYRFSRTYPRPFIIVTARGCPFKCSFCVNHSQGYRPRSIENIMEEIKLNYEKYKFNILIIQDELFVANKRRMIVFCESLIHNKEKNGWDFDWMMQTHANAGLDIESLKLAKKAGCYLFSYGLESASPEVLKSMNKKTKPEQIIEAIGLADELNISFAGNLIFGDPAETEQTMRESFLFYFQYGIDPFIFLSNVQPYPGSEIFDRCIENGIIKDRLKYYENIPNMSYNMTNLPDNVFNRWMKFISAMETSYLLIKSTDAYAWELDGEYLGHPMRRIYAKCPFCGHDNIYREALGNDAMGKFMVPGCHKCFKRIRVNIPYGMVGKS